LIRADTIVLCTGQESNRALYEELQELGVEAHLIGGAKKAEQLDALRAIEEGEKLAQAL
jgi:2,4-dienoyl-CoA reductase (NADPH2)